MIKLIIQLGLVGFVAWLIAENIPMIKPFKAVIYVIAVIACILIVMRAFGIQDVPLR